ncbi:MAG: cytochrome c maturation protein CcmE [Polyangiaceae bacterium]
MPDLDDELRQAMEESDAVPVTAPKDAPDAKKKTRGLNNVGLLVALVVIAGGILALVMTSFEDAAVYAKTVDQVVAEKDSLAGRTVRVTGTLVKGTLVRRDEPCEYRFRMQKNEKELAVRYAQCVVPDTFRDAPDMDVEVTAEGQLDDEGSLEATQIMAKCPSKYEMKEKAARGEARPHYDIPASAKN